MCLCVLNDREDNRPMPVDISLNGQSIDPGEIVEIAGKKYRVSITNHTTPTLDRIDPRNSREETSRAA